MNKIYESKAEEAFRKSKKPDDKPSQGGQGGSQNNTQAQKKPDEVKKAGMFNMFGDNVGDKKKEP